MMENIKKVVLCSLTTITLTIGFLSLNVNAEDNAPIIGDFEYDLEYDEIIQQKEMSLYQSRLAYPELVRLGRMGQRAQERSNWCGFAAMKTLLDYHDVNKTQTELNTMIRNNVNLECPWYFSNGNSKSEFPVPVKLTELLASKTGFNYIPYPYGAAGTIPISASDIKPKIMYTINSNHGVMACGNSAPTGNSHLPGYPAQNIGHWIAIDGYYNNGDYTWIIDPAKSPAVSWSGSISALYSIPTSNLAAFAQARGIVW